MHLERLPPVHIVTGGLFVSPELDPAGRVMVSAELQSLAPRGYERAKSAGATTTVLVSVVLRTQRGELIAQNTTVATVLSDSLTTVVRYSLLPPVGTVTPWDTWRKAGNSTILSPAGLYVLTASVGPLSTPLVWMNASDEVNVTCGFRQTSWAGKLRLNDAQRQLRGFSHHDNFAGVGVAMPARVFLFHAQAHRALGGNFWRMSHNPCMASAPSPPSVDFGMDLLYTIRHSHRNWPSALFQH